MKRLGFVMVLFCFVPTLAAGHHGVATLGVAGLEGPGAPLETSTSATLPHGGFLLFGKLDYADFEIYTPEVDDEANYNAYWLYSLGYGATSYLSLYLFMSFYTKTLEDNSYNTSGFADMALLGVLGFKWDEGFRLTPANESLDDLEDWHFTVYGGATIPTGNPNITDSSGSIDPGMSLGFGKPAYQVGLTTTKLFTSRATFVTETSYIGFSEYEYNDGNRVQFGAEFRFNTAFVLRTITNLESKFRLDGIMEAGVLRLGRDVLNGDGEQATGGDMLYFTPGARIFYKSTSIAAGLKIPVWTNLNEEDEQQGAEGKERYRFVATFSVLL